MPQMNKGTYRVQCHSRGKSLSFYRKQGHQRILCDKERIVRTIKAGKHSH